MRIYPYALQVLSTVGQAQEYAKGIEMRELDLATANTTHIAYFGAIGAAGGILRWSVAKRSNMSEVYLYAAIQHLAIRRSFDSDGKDGTPKKASSA